MGLTNGFGKHSGCNNYIDNDDIFIDPTAAPGGIGTFENPYNSFTGITITDNNTYRLKKGTTLSGSTAIDLSSKTGVVLSSYGVGEKPNYVLTAAGTCAVRFALSVNCVLSDWNISIKELGTSGTTYAVLALVQMGVGTLFNGGTGNTITDCVLHKCYGGGYPASGYNFVYGMAIRGGGSNLTINNCEMYDLAIDGIYARDTDNLVIKNCNIHDIGQNYQWSQTQANASGDGLQLDGNYANFYVGNTIFDRSDNKTGNKYGMICNHAEAYGNTNSGIVEYCTFKNNANVPTGLHIEFGLGVIVRYNKFEGPTLGIRLGGVYSVNTIVYNNLFYNSTGGIGIGYSYSGAGYTGGTPGNVLVGGATGSTVYNNVFYNISGYNNTNGAGCIWLDKSYVVMKNNIFCMSGNTGISLYNYGGGGYLIQNNCYDVYASAGPIGTGSTSVVSNPLFIDGPNHNFRLQDSSPCIGAGQDVGLIRDYDSTLIPQGLNPDIGAFEKII